MSSDVVLARAEVAPVAKAIPANSPQTAGAKRCLLIAALLPMMPSGLTFTVKTPASPEPLICRHVPLDSPRRARSGGRNDLIRGDLFDRADQRRKFHAYQAARRYCPAQGGSPQG